VSKGVRNLRFGPATSSARSTPGDLDGLTPRSVAEVIEIEPMKHHSDDAPSPEGRAGPEQPPISTESEEIVRQFVEHWGMMARAWGINSTMGELFALMYVTGTDWNADALREWLRVSRGNVSMNLRELMSWGVVHKIHRAGERREFFRAEDDVWTLFRRILSERKRRELDPTLLVLERSVARAADAPGSDAIRQRIASLTQFFGLIDRLASTLLRLGPEDLEDLRRLLHLAEDQPRSAPNGSGD
jgi:DNA-binding transcriptional regulator GbsR (MarR family)